MPRPRKVIDEIRILEECKEGATVTHLMRDFLGCRDTFKNRIEELIQSGKLYWAVPGSRGKAGILKTT